MRTSAASQKLVDRGGPLQMKALAKNSDPQVKTTHLSRARRTAILKAMADPHRFHLLEEIARAGCPLGCAQARSSLAISPATLSHHVKELENAGLITIEREGKFHFLSLRRGVLEALIATLDGLVRPSCKQG
jgi:ArsR family transcriptional regulator, arsenate/arsenite/antimonite-responsive transcriptional repressor